MLTHSTLKLLGLYNSGKLQWKLEVLRISQNETIPIAKCQSRNLCYTFHEKKKIKQKTVFCKI